MPGMAETGAEPVTSGAGGLAGGGEVGGGVAGGGVAGGVHGTDAQESTDARELTDAVTRLRRVLRAGIRTDISWESLPMAQVEILQSLADSAPTRVNDMAERLHLAQSTVSGLIGQMMTAGLVRRDVDSADRRAAVVTLTAAGEDQLRAWEAAHVQWIQGALSTLSPGDRSAISSSVPALRRLTDALAAGGGSEGG
jgi:DNA-binding MarR family transcriptional regulator